MKFQRIDNPNSWNRFRYEIVVDGRVVGTVTQLDKATWNRSAIWQAKIGDRIGQGSTRSLAVDYAQGRGRDE